LNDPTLLELATIVSALLLMAVVVRVFRARERTVDARVERLEARIYRLMHHVGVPDPSAELDETRRLAKDGHKERAIAAYRTVTGASYGDAKKVVEGMMPKPAEKK
jgi:hypothetical protein